MAWVGPHVVGGGVSGNPLGGVISVIQFDDFSPTSHCGTLGVGSAQQRKMDTVSTSAQERTSPLALSLTTQCPTISP